MNHPNNRQIHQLKEQILADKNISFLQIKIIQDIFHRLDEVFESKDTITSSKSTYGLLWELAMNYAKKTIFAFASNRESNSGAGFSNKRDLLRFQENLVSKNIAIHRIFSVEKNTYNQSNFIEIIREQINSGINISVISNSQANFLYRLKEFDDENYIIIDDTLLYRSYIKNGKTFNTITFNKKTIRDYIKMNEEILKFSKRIELHHIPPRFEEL